MDLMEAIRNRRTIGKSAGDISRETIRELIEAAVWAPNHKLTQPWKFNVLTGAARERLGAVWGAAAAAKADPAAQASVRDGRSEEAAARAGDRRREHADRSEPDDGRRRSHCTAAAVQNMLLAAHAKGLSAAWKTGKIVYSAEVKAFLGLAPDDRIVAFVYLGAEAKEEPLPRDRDIDGTITWMDEPALTV